MDRAKASSRMRPYLKLCVPLLIASMACAFAENMLFPPSPTPAMRTPSQTPSPSATATLPTETYTPTLKPVTCSDEKCVNDCLDRLNASLETKLSEPVGKAIYEDQGTEFELVIYKVNGDKISDPRLLYVPPEYQEYQKDTEAQLRIWNFYIAVIPPELRSTIRSFTIFTDGPEEATAWVSRSSTDTEYSKVGFDLLDSNYLPYLANTLVHETAHLLTLNSSQVVHDKDQPHDYDKNQHKFLGCDQYAADGGCSLPDSYINLFYQKFWKDSYAEWWKVDQEARTAETSDERWDMIEEKFYDKHKDWFLNSYAATSVEEDMAESFAFFVLHPKPSRQRIYHQKVTFYYDFPELVEYRQQMIEGLCSYIQ